MFKFDEFHLTLVISRINSGLYQIHSTVAGTISDDIDSILENVLP